MAGFEPTAHPFIVQAAIMCLQHAAPCGALQASGKVCVDMGGGERQGSGLHARSLQTCLDSGANTKLLEVPSQHEDAGTRNVSEAPWL